MDEIMSRFDFSSTGEHNLDVFEPNFSGIIPPESYEITPKLEAALKEGNLPIIRQLCTEYDTTAPKGSRPINFGSSIYFAVENGHKDTVEYLLSQEDFHRPSDMAKVATLRKDTAMLEVFLKFGWDINAQIEWSISAPLAFANDADLCAWYFSHGANPNASCELLDRTPLSYAVRDAPFPVIEMFFEHGGSLEFGQLLHYAVWRKGPDRLEVITYLLKKGASVNARVFENRRDCFLLLEAFGLGTPLHYAAARGDREIVDLLLAWGAKTTIKDSCQMLPFQVAENHGHNDVAQHLQTYEEEASRNRKAMK